MADLVRLRPTDASLAWVCGAVGRGAHVVRVRRLTGGITTATHAVDVVDRSGRRHRLVLRRFVHPDLLGHRENLIAEECRILAAMEPTDVPAPVVVAVDLTGADQGEPAMLMQRLPGRIDIAPTDVDAWLQQMASLLARIHDLPIDAPPHRLPTLEFDPPPWTDHPGTWTAAARLLGDGQPEVVPRFMHGDYQHFNMLWSRRRLTGIVDWTFSSSGPADLDVGHCRLNLALLHGVAVAERFRAMYESEAGRPQDPRWDLYAVARFHPGWAASVIRQVGQRMTIDERTINRGADELLQLALDRL